MIYIFTINVIFAVINFFISANPYAGFHGGNAGEDSGIYASSLYLNISGIMLMSLIVLTIFKKKYKFKLYFTSLIYCLLLLLTGIFNDGLKTHLITYIYDVLVFILTFSIAGNDIVKGNNNYDINLLFKITFTLYIFGCIFAIINPNVWGYLPFEFSRETRGENTLAYLTGSMIILPVLIISNYKSNIFIRFFAFLILLIITLSTSTRTALIVIFFPVIVYLLLQKNCTYLKRFWYVFIFLGVYLLKFLISFFIYDSPIAGLSSLEYSFSGRLELWDYLWNSLNNSPIIGSGAFLISKIDREIIAKSEVGLLVTAAEHGVIIALIKLYIVLVALYKSFRTIMNVSLNEYALFTSYITIVLFPFFLFQDYSRIMNISDFIFWYSVFYQYLSQLEIINSFSYK